ncbi:hypothetical protein H9Q70_000006 [Fusarium xylarioides]|nr:hypothetical protein H9Q70_000006 [Fusarium xylarioides]KAG5785951.1 hypothetical protein H9Q73_000389 [Fusarium xylarioides]
MSAQDNASGGGNVVTRTSSGGFIGQTSDPGQIVPLAHTVLRETGSTMILFTLEPGPDNSSGASGARGGSSRGGSSRRGSSRRGSSRAGLTVVPGLNLVTLTSSDGTIVGSYATPADQATSETDSVPDNMNGDPVVNGNSNSTN